MATYYEDLCSGCQPNKETAYPDGGPTESAEGGNRTSDARFDHASRTGREETKNEVQFESSNATATLTTINRTSIVGQPFDKADLAKGEILKNSNSTFNVSDIFDKDEPSINNRNSSSSYLFYSTWQLFKYFLAKSGSSATPLPAFNFTQQNQTSSASPACSSTANFTQLTADSSANMTGRKIPGERTPSETSTRTPLLSTSENDASISTNTSTAPQVTQPAAVRTKVNLLASPSGNSPETGTPIASVDSEIAAKTNKCPGLEINCSEFNLRILILLCSTLVQPPSLTIF